MQNHYIILILNNKLCEINHAKYLVNSRYFDILSIDSLIVNYNYSQGIIVFVVS